MIKKLHHSISILIFILSCPTYGQDISLYKQYNGKYDFVFFGNTLNKRENGINIPCEINTRSSAYLNLSPEDEIENAYLYWAGSGTGDLNVKLNGEVISAQRIFNVIQKSSNLPFFSAFADITTQIKTSGNGLYDFSDLDLTAVIGDYCFNATNFGGWAIIVVYKNDTLPLNQLTIYDGLQYVPEEINITLNSLNVIDNQNAKIGFLTWEGDRSISENETLLVNGNPISNPPLNPVNNAFNGTNSFMASSNLYNMDLDVYDIQNNIKTGDTSAQIQLTSGRDFVMINSIVTKLNSQLPDARIEINDISFTCDSKEILVDYTVFNSASTNPLASGTPIAIYANETFIQSTLTRSVIQIDGSENNTITIKIPDIIPNGFDLKFVVNDDGKTIGIVPEININNNTDIVKNTSFWLSPKINSIPNLESCNQGFGIGVFDFSNYVKTFQENQEDDVSFYNTLGEAEIGIKNGAISIPNPDNFITQTSVTTIYVRIENEHCHSVTSLKLILKNCPPTIYNYISPNNDGYNDTFVIKGLRDIFLNYKISIYNRWGVLIWTGNNNTKDWDGHATKGTLLDNQKVPDGTYYYILELNDPENKNPLVGFLFLTK